MDPQPVKRLHTLMPTQGGLARGQRVSRQSVDGSAERVPAERWSSPTPTPSMSVSEWKTSLGQPPQSGLLLCLTLSQESPDQIAAELGTTSESTSSWSEVKCWAWSSTPTAVFQIHLFPLAEVGENNHIRVYVFTEFPPLTFE